MVEQQALENQRQALEIQRQPLEIQRQALEIQCLGLGRGEVPYASPSTDEDDGDRTKQAMLWEKDSDDEVPCASLSADEDDCDQKLPAARPAVDRHRHGNHPPRVSTIKRFRKANDSRARDYVACNEQYARAFGGPR